jgi:hypothetical protein
MALIFTDKYSKSAWISVNQRQKIFLTFEITGVYVDSARAKARPGPFAPMLQKINMDLPKCLDGNFLEFFRLFLACRAGFYTILTLYIRDMF